MIKKNIRVNRHYVYLGVLYIFGLVVVFLRPLDVQQWQWADEAMYLNNAMAIINNLGGAHWLGLFDELLLAKAPFFPVFIALIHGIGIPLRFAEFMLFSPLPFLFWAAVRPLSLPRWPVLYIATLCLMFIPTVGMELRLLRTVVFGAMALYGLTALCGLLIRIFVGEGRPWLWALVGGLSIGLAATTREEAVWLVVPAILTVLGGVYFAWCRKKFSTLIFVLPFLFVGYLTPATIFSTLNYNSYNVYAPSLRQQGDFKRLYSLLASLEPEQRQKYVPIGTEVRHIVYKVSPHFAELEPFLEGPALDPFAKSKAHFMLNGWDYVMDSREFFVSNFEWALAKAIFLSGRITADEMLSFCREVAKEIMFAIEKGRIKQGVKGISLLPPIVTSDYSSIVMASYKSIKLLFEGESIGRNSLLKPNPVPDVALKWHEFLGTRSSTSSQDTQQFSDYVFNNFLIKTLKYSYVAIIISGIFSLLYLYRVREKNVKIFSFLLIASWSALGSFNVVMGVVDTVAWPTLNWPGSYNAMGFFPLHFLLLISLVVTLGAINRVVSKRGVISANET